MQKYFSQELEEHSEYCLRNMLGQAALTAAIPAASVQGYLNREAEVIARRDANRALPRRPQ